MSETSVFKLLKCDVCDVVRTTAESLRFHMLLHSSKPPFKCNQCGETFTCKSYLSQHNRIVHRVNVRHRCEVCQKTFKTKGCLLQHQKLGHKGKNAYNCDNCGVSFTNKLNYEKHVATHTGGKRYECVKCGTVFTSRVHLTQHKTTHLKEKQHNCDECGFNFASDKRLQKHILRGHATKKVYPCNACDIVFAGKGSLEEHLLLQHARRKEVPCNVCGSVFANKRRLTEHIVCEHSFTKKAPPCETCGQCFRHKSFCKERAKEKPNDTDAGTKLEPENLMYILVNKEEFHKIGDDISLPDAASDGFSGYEVHDNLITAEESSTAVITPNSNNARNEELLVPDVLEISWLDTVDDGFSENVTSRPNIDAGARATENNNDESMNNRDLLGEKHKESNVASEMLNDSFLEKVMEATIKTELSSDGPESTTEASADGSELGVPGEQRKESVRLENVKSEMLNYALTVTCSDCGCKFVGGADADMQQCTACKEKRKQSDASSSLLRSNNNALLQVNPQGKKDEVGKNALSRPSSVILNIIPNIGLDVLAKDVTVVRISNSVTKKKPVEVSIGVQTTSKSRKCVKCRATFTHKKDLRQHKCSPKAKQAKNNTAITMETGTQDGPTIQPKVNANKKQFSCDNCTIRFNFITRKSFQRHMRVHTGEASYMCDLCGAPFVKEAALNKHLMCHADRQPYKCDVCGSAFKGKKRLKEHMVEHTGEERHKCEVCGLPFILEANLRQHMRVHTGQAPYMCHTCGKKFFFKRGLLKHQRYQQCSNRDDCHAPQNQV